MPSSGNEMRGLLIIAAPLHYDVPRFHHYFGATPCVPSCSLSRWSPWFAWQRTRPDTRTRARVNHRIDVRPTGIQPLQICEKAPASPLRVDSTKPPCQRVFIVSSVAQQCNCQGAPCPIARPYRSRGTLAPHRRNGRDDRRSGRRSGCGRCDQSSRPVQRRGPERAGWSARAARAVASIRRGPMRR